MFRLYAGQRQGTQTRKMLKMATVMLWREGNWIHWTLMPAMRITSLNPSVSSNYLDQSRHLKLNPDPYPPPYPHHRQPLTCPPPLLPDPVDQHPQSPNLHQHPPPQGEGSRVSFPASWPRRDLVLRTEGEGRVGNRYRS